MIDEKRKAEIRKNIEGVRRDFVLNVTPARINISFDDLDRLLRAERIDEARRSIEQVKRQCILDAKPEDEWEDGYHQAGLDLEAAFVARIAELENPQ